MVVRILGDGEQMPKATDLLVELANFVGAFLGVTDDPDVLHHVVHVDCFIGHGWIPFDIAQGPLRSSIHVLVLLKGSPQHHPSLCARRLRGLADIDLSADAELLAVRCPAGAVMGIQPRSPAMRRVSEFGVDAATPMGGWGFW
jgi:hypothetical protein